ncbi:MAG: ribonuclease Z [bacterium]
MTPCFHPKLVNGPFQDPALYIDFLYHRRAILFDVGDITALSTREIHKITEVFVSHTHMDHFIGLDHMLRLFLGRDKRLTIYGPPRIISNVAGKLSAYTWDLVENYESKFEITVVEVHPDHLKSAIFRCHNVFKQEQISETRNFNQILIDEEEFRISALFLDHSTPCLAFSFEEKFHINIKKDRLDTLGLPAGPWLNELKKAVREERPDEFQLVIPENKNKGIQGSEMTMRWIREKELFGVSRGQKIVYVVDIGYTPKNLSGLIPFAKGADYLFCEAAFLERDKDIAMKKHHLTAHQAGLIAKEAGVRKIIPFHFSPRYQDSPDLIYIEAESAFKT